MSKYNRSNNMPETPLENKPVETVEDYQSSRAKIEWCKRNILKAKNNPHLGSRYVNTIREKLLAGIWVKSKGVKEFRRFDYPAKYIREVMKPSQSVWNMWVIKVALEITDEDELLDLDDVSVFFEEDLTLSYGKKNKKSPDVSVKGKLLKKGILKEGVPIKKKKTQVVK